MRGKKSKGISKGRIVVFPFLDKFRHKTLFVSKIQEKRLVF